MRLWFWRRASAKVGFVQRIFRQHLRAAHGFFDLALQIGAPAVHPVEPIDHLQHGGLGGADGDGHLLLQDGKALFQAGQVIAHHLVEFRDLAPADDAEVGRQQADEQAQHGQAGHAQVGVGRAEDMNGQQQQAERRHHGRAAQPLDEDAMAPVCSQFLHAHDLRRRRHHG
jgi:hypothetical protein